MVYGSTYGQKSDGFIDYSSLCSCLVSFVAYFFDDVTKGTNS